MAGIVVHGVILWPLQRFLGWGVFAAGVIGLGLVTAGRGVLASRLGTGAVVAYWLYVAAAALVTVVQATFLGLHSPIVSLVVVFAVAWVGALLAAGYLRLGVTAAVVAMGAAALWFAQPGAWWQNGLLLAPAVIVSLVAVFVGRFALMGRWLFAIFVGAWLAAFPNYAFLHTVDLDIAHLLNREGVIPVLVWHNQPSFLEDTIGVDVRWTRPGLKDRLVFGGDNGVFLLEPTRLREIPVGPAGDNIAVDHRRGRTFLVNRQGRFFVLANEAMAIVAQVDMGGKGGAVRLSPAGVIASTRNGHVTLFDKYSAQAIHEWKTGSLGDVIVDPEGEAIAATRSGKLVRFHPGGRTAQRFSLFGLSHRLAIDEAQGRLFATGLLNTEVRVLGAEDLAEVQRLPVGFGSLAVHWDEKTASLIVGRYFTGEVVVFHGAPLEEIARLRVGRRLTDIAGYRPGRILTTSAGGVFAIDLATVAPTKPEDNK